MRPPVSGGLPDASRWALGQAPTSGQPPTAEQLRCAARYLLAELPLFTDTAGIVGVATSVFCYPQSIPFLHQVYHRDLAWTPVPGQGFAVLTPTLREAPAPVY